MTFKDYLAKLKSIAKADPESLKLPVIFASDDDEGSNYQEVFYMPSIGRFDGSSFDDTPKKPNAICIN